MRSEIDEELKGNHHLMCLTATNCFAIQIL